MKRRGFSSLVLAPFVARLSPKAAPLVEPDLVWFPSDPIMIDAIMPRANGIITNLTDDLCGD